MITRKVKLLSVEEEQRLVRAAQAGSKASLHRLLEAHYLQMYHLALKVTRNTVWAEDVTQEACMQVLKRIDQFRSESRFSSWLCRIVVNTALLRHRREKRLVPTDELLSLNEVSPDPLPEQQLIDRELLRKTDEALSELRDGDRELFMRRFVDGLSLQSISEETGLSLPALKSRFHRARHRLKENAVSHQWAMDFSDESHLGRA